LQTLGRLKGVYSKEKMTIQCPVNDTSGKNTNAHYERNFIMQFPEYRLKSCERQDRHATSQCVRETANGFLIFKEKRMRYSPTLCNNEMKHKINKRWFVALWMVQVQDLVNEIAH
jgi:hypothetical protein